jgi:histone deacetylase complex regulatory component SIN3
MPRLDTFGIMIRILSLFSDHSYLVTGFQTFLPRGMTVELFEDGMGAKHAILTTERQFRLFKPAYCTGENRASMSREVEL